MENLLPWILKSTAILGLIYVVLSLLNIHWLMRIRIIASMGLGALILGTIGWRLVSPSDPLGTITLYHGTIRITDALICVGLAFLAGAGGYMVSFPYGKMLGLLAAPAGMAVWAFNSGNMRMLLFKNETLSDRIAVYSFLRWESFYWLLLVLAGAAGSWIAGKLIKPKIDPFSEPDKPKYNTTQMVFILLSLVASVIIAQFVIILFAQDVKYSDSVLGTVIGQPGNRQIALAVFVAFLLAAFAIKVFLDGSYYIAFLAAPILGIYVIQTTCNQQVLEHMNSNWSVVYFPNALCAILPIQLIPFSAIGALSGHWLGKKYKESKSTP